MVSLHNDFDEREDRRSFHGRWRIIALAAVPALCIIGYITYSQFRIDVPAMHFAVLTKKPAT